MLTDATVNQLRLLRLDGMAEAYDRQRSSPDLGTLSFDERFAMLVDSQWARQQNLALERRLKRARLRQNACLEDIDWEARRGLKRELVAQLSTSDWVRQARHCLITGPTGVGKSWLACALAQKACRDGHRVVYSSATKLFRDLLAASVDGTLTALIRRLSRPALLVIDDWGLEQARRGQYRDFLELVDERQDRGSLLLTSQMPPDSWHEVVGDPTVADAILDRIVHRAYRIDLDGESMRRPPQAATRPSSPAQPDGLHGQTVQHPVHGGKL